MILVTDTSGLIASADSTVQESSACRAHLQRAGTVVVSPLVLAELDHVARARFSAAERHRLVSFVVAQIRSTRFVVAKTTSQVLDAAVAVQARYAGLDLDLTDAVLVATAADYRTDAILTLDRRDFRAIQPLTSHRAFRVLPDDD